MHRIHNLYHHIPFGSHSRQLRAPTGIGPYLIANRLSILHGMKRHGSRHTPTLKAHPHLTLQLGHRSLQSRRRMLQHCRPNTL